MFPNFYTALLLALEVWFQFETMAIIPFVHWMPRLGLYGLLVSHWMWIAVAILTLVPDKPCPCRRGRAGPFYKIQPQGSEGGGRVMKRRNSIRGLAAKESFHRKSLSGVSLLQQMQLMTTVVQTKRQDEVASASDFIGWREHKTRGEVRHAAAVRIQKIARGRIARNRDNIRPVTAASAAGALGQDAPTRKIGRKLTRSNSMMLMERMSVQKDIARGNAPSTSRLGLLLRVQEQLRNEAATAIQAQERGRQAREHALRSAMRAVPRLRKNATDGKAGRSCGQQRQAESKHQPALSIEMV